MLQHGRIALPQTVHVHDRAEIVQSSLSAHFRRFPHRSLDGFAVAHQDIGAVVGLVDRFRIEREPHTSRQSPAPTTRSPCRQTKDGESDGLRDRNRGAQLQQPDLGNRPPPPRPHRAAGRRMALGEDKSITVRQLLDSLGSYRMTKRTAPQRCLRRSNSWRMAAPASLVAFTLSMRRWSLYWPGQSRVQALR